MHIFAGHCGFVGYGDLFSHDYYRPSMTEQCGNSLAAPTHGFIINEPCQNESPLSPNPLGPVSCM